MTFDPHEKNPFPTASHKRDEGASYPYLSTRAPSSDPSGHLLPLGEKKPRWTLSVQRHLQHVALFLSLLFTSLPAFAFNPDEVLKDPILEGRARALTVQLRCMVCQNQSIDDSNAELARDLRVLVRERLTAGDSDEAVMNYVVSRYGEFVLLKPRVSARTLALWGAPVVLILIGASAIFVFARRRVTAGSGETLSVDEEARIRDLLEKG